VFSLASFLAFGDKACVAFCVHQLLSLYHAYPVDLALQRRLGSPHLPRCPLPAPPVVPLPFPPIPGPSPRPRPHPAVISRFIALCMEGMEGMEGMEAMEGMEGMEAGILLRRTLQGAYTACPGSCRLGFRLFQLS